MELSRATLAALLALGSWFGLDFIGVRGLVDREPLVSLAGFMLALLIAFLVAGALHVRYAALPYALALLVWLVLQVEAHWRYYVLVAPQSRIRWYDRAFGDHLRILPAFPGRTTPDAFHTVLLALLLLNLILALRDIYRPARGAQTLGAAPGP
jgi:hypothetical protein